MSNKLAVAVEQIETLNSELDEWQRRMNALNNMVRIQCSDGNWNYNEYMRGLANGLLLAWSTFNDVEYAPLEPPVAAEE